MIASHSCCRFVSCTSMMWISRSTTSQNALLDWDLVTVEAIWVTWTHYHVQETSLRWFELCDKYIRRWYTVVIKGWTWSATILREAVVLKRCSIGTKGPKCAKKISPTPLHHHHQPEPLRQGRMNPCFHVLYTKFWLYIWMSQLKLRLIRPGNVFSIFNRPILVSLCELYPPCAVLIWQERHPVWSSAAVVHLLQGLTCCVFRDGILHNLVVMSGYLSYCCLSIISNQSVHSPLTSDINKAFWSSQLPLTGYFLFFRPFSVNPRDSCVWKSQ